MDGLLKKRLAFRKGVYKRHSLGKSAPFTAKTENWEIRYVITLGIYKILAERVSHG